LSNELCPLAAAMEDGTARQAEVYLHHRKGHRIPVSVRATPLRDKAGNVIGGAELFSDISSKKALQEKIRELEKLALIDGLTGLSNRKHIEGELVARFHEKNRYGLDFGILFMDIDNFKTINDTYGHVGGDTALKTVSATFQASTRSYDLVGRWGGEEFVGIIRNVDHQLLGKVGERFRMLIEKTRIEYTQTPFSVTMSVGATLAIPEDTPASLIKRADEYLYESKKNGRNRLTVCDVGNK
jgi:diguanylate cyclase (GGDEF)-like protein